MVVEWPKIQFAKICEHSAFGPRFLVSVMRLMGMSLHLEPQILVRMVGLNMEPCPWHHLIYQIFNSTFYMKRIL